LFSAPGSLVKVLSCSLFVVAVKNTLALGEEERVGLRKRPSCPADSAVGVKIGCGVGVPLGGLGVGDVGEVGRLDEAGSLGEVAMEVGNVGRGWRKK
jgi:hypothetical protein